MFGVPGIALGTPNQVGGDPILIRLMTYNICGGLGMDGKRSLARIVEVARSAGAQIVCLQEVHRFLPNSRLVDQARRLGDRLGMVHVYQRNYSLGAGGLGNAILTSLDVVSVCSHRLTSLGEHRGLLEVHLKTPEGDLTVFCTHLGLDAMERATQAGEIAAAVNAAKGPRVLCGDFNETISSPAVSSILESTGFRDALPEGFLTFPSNDPTHRIDFVFCDPIVGAISAGQINTIASDHLPVAVDLDIGDAPASHS